MPKSDLRAVRIKAHIRDIDELRRAARRLRNGVKRLPALKPSSKPSPMEPWQSGFTTIEVKVPQGGESVMALAAKRLLKERSKL